MRNVRACILQQLHAGGMHYNIARIAFFRLRLATTLPRTCTPEYLSRSCPALTPEPEHLPAQATMQYVVAVILVIEPAKSNYNLNEYGFARPCFHLCRAILRDLLQYI
jgi:hypothetical protein